MIVGLTGGIGSGKSTVARLLEIFGCLIVNSDKVAQEAYFDKEISKQVKNLLGATAYLNDGTLNKRFISEQIFKDEKLLAGLNAIIHPFVKLQMQVVVKNHPNKIIIKESALLFEAKLEKQVDKLVVVFCPDDLRISRVMQRDNLSKPQVQARINNQIPQQEKVSKADYVIQNDEKQLLIPQVLKLYEELTKHNQKSV